MKVRNSTWKLVKSHEMRFWQEERWEWALMVGCVSFWSVIRKQLEGKCWDQILAVQLERMDLSIN